MSVSSKVALSWILIGNTYQGLRELEVDSAPLDHTDLDWGVVQYIVTIACFLVLIIGIPVISARPVNKESSANLEMNTNFRRQQRKNFKTISF